MRLPGKILLILAAGLAGPALAQACDCGAGNASATIKVVTKVVTKQTLIDDDCAWAPRCGGGGGWYPRHPGGWRPARGFSTTGGQAGAGASAGSRNTIRMPGNTINIYNASNANDAAPPNAPVSPGRSDIVLAIKGMQNQIGSLDQRIDMLDGRLARTNGWLGWIIWGAVLLGIALLLALLGLALWALLAARRDSRASAADARHSADTIAAMQTRLREQDRAFDGLHEDVVRLRQDLTRARTERSPAGHAHPHATTGEVIEEVGVLATAAAAGAAIGAHHHAAADHQPRTVAEPASAPWTIAHYQDAIELARRRPHDRVTARQDVIRLSGELIAHHPGQPRAISYARVMRAEALFEERRFDEAIADCEAVITMYGGSHDPHVRANLAQAHFIKASFHAQRRNIPAACAALDQWAAAAGRFDRARVVDDIQFKDIVETTEFKEYLTTKGSA